MPMITERISAENVVDAFTYQPWDEAQKVNGDRVRDALIFAAQVILASAPESPLRTRALNNLVDARMLTNAAITFKGRF